MANGRGGTRKKRYQPDRDGTQFVSTSEEVRRKMAMTPRTNKLH